MSESKVARRYAVALFDACSEAKNHPIVGKQLMEFTRLWSTTDDLRAVVSNPVVGLDDKRKILEKVWAKLALAPTTLNFLRILFDKDRLTDLPDIYKEFAELFNASQNRLRATVTSAVPLAPPELARIEAALKRLTGKNVSIDAKVDPTLLGGVVTQVGSVVLDGSVRTDLELLRETLVG